MSSTNVEVGIEISNSWILIITTRETVKISGKNLGLYIPELCFFLFFFIDRPTSEILILAKKKKLKFWIYFFRSTDRPYKKHLEKIREAKNQLCLA